MKKNLIIIIFRFIIGMLFIVSGISKIANIQEFVQLTAQYGLGVFSYLSVIIPPIEVLLGLALILGCYLRATGLTLSILTAFFTLIFIYGTQMHNIENCGCFGSFIKLSMPVWLLYTRNVLIIIGGYLIYTMGRNEVKVYHFWLLIFTGLICFTASGISFSKPFYKNDYSEQYVGKPLPWNLSRNLNLKKDKRYAIFVFSPTCSHCWDATANLIGWKTAGYVDEVIAVTSINAKTQVEDTYQPKFNTNFMFYYLENKNFETGFNKLPRVLLVKNLTVEEVSGPIFSSGYVLTNQKKAGN